MSEENKVTTLTPLRASTALSSEAEWNREVGRWQALIRSGALPKHVDTPVKAIAIVRMGETYGWDPMRSLRSIYVVEGRPELSAESMLALIREKAPEAVVQPVEMTAERAAIRVTRPPQVPEPVEVSVTAEEFRHLIKKTKKGFPSVWMLYTADMLWARCVSRLGRRVFPDVIAGAYTLGELEEFAIEQIGPRESDPIDEPIEDVEEIDHVDLEPGVVLPGDEDAP